MKKEWSGRDWSARVDGRTLIVESRGEVACVHADNAGTLRAHRKWFGWQLRYDGTRVARMRGLRGRDARTMALAPVVWAAVDWQQAVDQAISSHMAQQRWMPCETTDELLAMRPRLDAASLVRRARARRELTQSELTAVSLVGRDVAADVELANRAIGDAEWVAHRRFFDSIERSPLTEEQGRAVIVFDNRVQLIAAAGSGKTSVMVARAAYAVSRGFIEPERILLLAFNRAAADELGQRVRERFAAAGITSVGVKASTFHSFGLEVIGKATGRKPRLAPWLEGGGDLRMVHEIVDQLRDSSKEFRYKWDLYRLLFADLAPTPSGGDPDGYDAASSRTGIRTFKGDLVKSHGERLVANWLYLNGVEYQYEAPYEHDVATSERSQYRPDFYYPEVQVWHEHWALDRDGNAPPEFSDYLDGMAWKRAVHRQHGTSLIETTWADVVYGDGLQKLQTELESRGLTLDWNPDRPVSSGKGVKHEDLERLVRTFMTHIKSGSLGPDGLHERLRGSFRWLSGLRSALFLDIYWPVHEEWNRRLRAAGEVDFEDMLLEAANHLESGAYDAPYDLILVDEFQDASVARARMIRGLLRKPQKYLLAVGDDWQSINRFAGADLSVLSRFEEWFGRGPTMQLTRTFRCTQVIADVASKFVMKNTEQFRKEVRGVRSVSSVPVRLVRANNASSALASALRHLDESEDQRIAKGEPRQVRSVFVLGRYWFDRDAMPSGGWHHLDVRFMTAHAAKGLEADAVIVPRLVAGTYGFPSQIADDPILELAAATSQSFPFAEERRLFYVALTRARSQVILITEAGRESRFATELLADRVVEVVRLDGSVEVVQVCPECLLGTLVRRTGRYGVFMGCSTFPTCRHTQSVLATEPER